MCWLRRELCRLHELASDRVEIYTVTKQERLEFAQIKESGQQPPTPRARSATVLCLGDGRNRSAP